MWRLSIAGVKEIAADAAYGVSWEPVHQKGTPPGRISHHKSVVFGSTVVVYGGICEEECAWEFETSKATWTKLKQTGDLPGHRDDHSLCKLSDNSFAIMGGFFKGARTQDLYVATKNGTTLSWKRCGASSA